VEYFTVGHPPIFQTESPTLLGLGWGVIATWWVGAMLGVPLALAARAGKQPKLVAGDLVKPVAVLLACMAVCAAVAGVGGYWVASRGVIQLQGTVGAAVPPERHARYFADACAHLTSYGTGFLGGLVLVGWTLVARYKADVRRTLDARRAERSAPPS
jgi:hypothetical protein